jgi:hypothetical protein
MVRDLILLVLLAAGHCAAQDRYSSGDLKGFTRRSPSEHFIDRIKGPFIDSSVGGTIMFQSQDEALKGVLFEIRGPGDSEHIWFAKTDRLGRFKIRHVPEGTYAFKATFDSFSSMVGMIIVSETTDKKKQINFEMSPDT